MPTYDEISDLPEEQQEQFHYETQKHLREQWAEAKNRTETEIDIERKTRCQM